MAKHSKQMNVYKQINKHAIHLGHMATELICNEDDWDRILEHFPFLTGQVPKHFQSRTQKDQKKKKLPVRNCQRWGGQSAGIDRRQRHGTTRT